jgi:hypothetical protein
VDTSVVAVDSSVVAVDSSVIAVDSSVHAVNLFSGSCFNVALLFIDVITSQRVKTSQLV